MFDIQCFAKMLQKYRKERGLTQGELASRLFVTPQSVSSWECGKGMPDIAHLCSISEVLSVSVDTLLRERTARARGLIGIDGGGTKTEFVLVDEWGDKLSSIRLGGCNPNACGIEEAIDTLLRGIAFLRPRQMNVVGIFLGGAGFDVGDYAERVVKAIQADYPGVKVGCANDIYNVIACSAQPDRCIAAISGTGCIVYSSCGGEVRRYGGLGYLFERSGSGYDLGREAISAALWARDGTGERTLLTTLVEAKLGGRAWEYIQELYKKDVSYIASFAPLVTQAAEQGDPVARGILERSGEYMTRMIQTARRNAPGVRNVILSGSLFAKNDAFYQLVAGQLDPELTVERMTWPPVWGACLQCARLCGLEQMPSLERFQAGQ